MEEYKWSELSGRLEKFPGEVQGKVEQYAQRLAEEGEHPDARRDALYGEIRSDIETLKGLSASCKKAHLQAPAAADELGARPHDVRASRKKRLIPAAPANTVIDAEEKRAGHFAQGINLYKLFMVCFIGSFAGVVVEMLWCLVKNGYIESRAGLVYGPFNLLYGFGAVALTLALYQYRNRSGFFSFAGGFIVGSAVEYFCSWAQELVFGSRSWDYSGAPFNINGRICLQYSIFWGVLGLLWIKNIYPRMSALILRIPNRAGKILTWALAAFLVFDAAVTLIAMDRWAARQHEEAPSSGFARFIDQRFPDERMERIFANMKFD